MDLKKLVDNIEKEFGKDAICGNTMEVDRVSSGSLLLDKALGGGYALGRLVEIMGGESSSKTTLAIHACREIQDRGKAVGYIDTEQAMDLDYVASIGVDLSPEKFILSQAETAEMALTIMKRMLDCEEIGIVVLDSIAALVPKARIDGNVGDQVIALTARLLSAELPIIAQKAKRNNTLVICINQYRSNIGGFMGPTNVTPGGQAMKFYASQRIETARIGNKQEGDEVSAIRVKATIKKNKVAPPFRKAELTVRFGIGIDVLQEILDLAVEQELIKKAGSWYSYGDVRLGQGEANVRNMLTDNPELLEEIRLKINVD